MVGHQGVQHVRTAVDRVRSVAVAIMIMFAYIGRTQRRLQQNARKSGSTPQHRRSAREGTCCPREASPCYALFVFFAVAGAPCQFCFHPIILQKSALRSSLHGKGKAQAPGNTIG